MGHENKTFALKAHQMSVKEKWRADGQCSFAWLCGATEMLTSCTVAFPPTQSPVDQPIHRTGATDTLVFPNRRHSALSTDWGPGTMQSAVYGATLSVVCGSNGRTRSPPCPVFSSLSPTEEVQ